MIPSRWGRALVIPALLLVAAEAAARVTDMRSDALAPPSAVASALASIMADGTLLAATMHTLACAAAGLALGGGAGVALGLLTGSLPWLDRTLSVSIEALRPVPPVALIPIALLVFGFGLRMEIATVAFGCVWPLLVLTRSAVRSIEPALGEVARVLRLGAAAHLTKIVLPAALPRMLVALRLAAGIALIVAVTAEITANPVGLGYEMIAAEQTLRPATMLAFLFWTGLLGWAVNAALLLVQSRWFGMASTADAGR